MAESEASNTQNRHDSINRIEVNVGETTGVPTAMKGRNSQQPASKNGNSSATTGSPKNNPHTPGTPPGATTFATTTTCISIAPKITSIRNPTEHRTKLLLATFLSSSIESESLQQNQVSLIWGGEDSPDSVLLFGSEDEFYDCNGHFKGKEYWIVEVKQAAEGSRKVITIGINETFDGTIAFKAVIEALDDLPIGSVVKVGGPSDQVATPWANVSRDLFDKLVTNPSLGKLEFQCVEFNVDQCFRLAKSKCRLSFKICQFEDPNWFAHGRKYLTPDLELMPIPGLQPLIIEFDNNQTFNMNHWDIATFERAFELGNIQHLAIIKTDWNNPNATFLEEILKVAKQNGFSILNTSGVDDEVAS